MRAAEAGNVSILKVLMAGALVAKTGEKAAEAGKELLKGAGVKLPDIKVPGLGDAPLGATELDLQDSTGQTALMKAAAAGQVQTVKLLHQANSQSANLQDNKGQTALTYAILKGSPDCANVLLGGWIYENSIRDNEGNTPLSHAIGQGNVEICKAVMNVTIWGTGNQARGPGRTVFPSMADNQGRTPLMRAVARGNNEIVQLLLDSFDKDYKARFAYIQRKDNNGKWAIKLAEEGDHQGIAALLKECNEAISKNPEGRTALMEAAETGSIAKAKALLARGADVLASDDKGQTALMIAAAKGHAELAKALLASFADNNQQRLDYLNQKDKSGKTAAKVAEDASHKELAALFRDYTDFDLKDDMGLTPLMKACQAGDRLTIAKLVAKGADVTAKDKEGMTALMHAAAKGQASVIPLVGPKADELRDSQGRTALMHAADNGHLDAARAIVQIVGAHNPSIPAYPIRDHNALVDKSGKTARQLAEQKKHQDVVQYLSGL
jgi:cytohesin